MNSDLLKECCVKVQLPGLIPERTAISSSTHPSFSHLEFKIAGSNVNFVRGLPASILSNYRHKKQVLDGDPDGDSLASASSEELKKSEIEELREE